MMKLALLCLLAVVVYAKPAVKQEGGSRPVTFLELIHTRPERPSTIECDSNGRLNIYTGAGCSGAHTVYACDGSCTYVKEGTINTVEIDSLPDGYVVSVDFFADNKCVGKFLGTADLDDGQCYSSNYFDQTTSFACYSKPDIKTIPPLHVGQH